MICDKFYLTSVATNAAHRFNTGHQMCVVVIEDKELTKAGSDSYGARRYDGDTGYPVNRMTCCSAVKDTIWNWFYIVPRSIKERLEVWLEELRPAFPTLGLELKEVDSSLIDNAESYSKSYFSPYNKNMFINKDDKGEFFTIELPIKRSSIQSSWNFTVPAGVNTAEVKDLFGVCEPFRAYCVRENIMLDEDNLKDVVKSFLKNTTPITFDNYIFVNSTSVFFRINHSGLWYSGPLSRIVDFTKTTPDDFYKYIMKIVTANFKVFRDCICDELYVKKNKKVLILSALYKKRRYSVEGYLAHILIRAAFTDQIYPFVEQYYEIKKKMPDLYFWNLIMLTQFGFNVNPYYWLTESRTFKFTTEEEFIKCAEDYRGISANFFFTTCFSKTIPYDLTLRLSGEYLRGNFKAVINASSTPMKVAPTKQMMARSHNFMVADSYDVTLETDWGYCITGDDYMMRTYKKSNFVVV